MEEDYKKAVEMAEVFNELYQDQKKTMYELKKIIAEQKLIIRSLSCLYTNDALETTEM